MSLLAFILSGCVKDGFGCRGIKNLEGQCTSAQASGPLQCDASWRGSRYKESLQAASSFITDAWPDHVEQALVLNLG